jgi:hypothetical protein
MHLVGFQYKNILPIVLLQIISNNESPKFVKLCGFSCVCCILIPIQVMAKVLTRILAFRKTTWMSYLGYC